jgi:hypothetical protein
MEQQGRYYDSINIKTDSTIQPVLTVKVYGNIYDRPKVPEMVVPPKDQSKNQ